MQDEKRIDGKTLAEYIDMLDAFDGEITEESNRIYHIIVDGFGYSGNL